MIESVICAVYVWYVWRSHLGTSFDSNREEVPAKERK